MKHGEMRDDRAHIVQASSAAPNPASEGTTFGPAKITRLALYEPPVRAADHSATLARMEEIMRTGDREKALMTFMTDIVLMSADEVAAMKTRPSWAGLLATVERSVRQDRALSQYRFDPVRARAMTIPTLLMAGSKTTSAVKMDADHRLEREREELSRIFASGSQLDRWLRQVDGLRRGA